MALSLVLSLLLFKPAPLYILDEVDAALDLSHTQNIGQMLRTHFTHSQVLYISERKHVNSKTSNLEPSKAPTADHSHFAKLEVQRVMFRCVMDCAVAVRRGQVKNVPQTKI